MKPVFRIAEYDADGKITLREVSEEELLRRLDPETAADVWW